jgi:hypothetical protein
VARRPASSSLRRYFFPQCGQEVSIGMEAFRAG